MNGKYDQGSIMSACRLYKEGWGFYKISRVFDCDPSTVRRWIIKEGVEIRKFHYSEKEKSEAVKFYKENTSLTLSKAADRIGVSVNTLKRWLSDHGVETHQNVYRTTDRNAILRDIKAGLHKKEIARRNSCSERWVYKIQAGEG